MDGEKRTKTTHNIHFFFLNFYTIDIWTLSPERIADCLALEGKINYSMHFSRNLWQNRFHGDRDLRTSLDIFFKRVVLIMKIYTDRNWVIVKDKKKTHQMFVRITCIICLCVFTVAMEVLFFLAQWTVHSVTPRPTLTLNQFKRPKVVVALPGKAVPWNTRKWPVLSFTPDGRGLLFSINWYVAILFTGYIYCLDMEKYRMRSNLSTAYNHS